MVDVTCEYFVCPGADNTERALALARRRAEELHIRTVLVASTSGATGALASEMLRGLGLVVVSHSAGFSEGNRQEMLPEHRGTIEANGGRILTCQHAFGGVGRAVRKELQTYQVDEIIAYALRIFGEGVKVACEISLMAADAGLVRVGEPAIAVGGTGHGADTALVLLPTNAQTFFDLRVMEVLCKPGFYPARA